MQLKAILSRKFVVSKFSCVNKKCIGFFNKTWKIVFFIRKSENNSHIAKTIFK